MAKKILIGAYLTLISCLLTIGVFAYAQQGFLADKPDFIGKDQAQVGELVRCSAEGEVIRWSCLPATEDCESYGSKNENFVISFREAGTYTIIAAVYNSGELTIHTQEIVITSVQPPPPTPQPPTPQPPTPTPTIDPALVMKVQSWVDKYKVEKDMCLALAANFEAVAQRIKAGELVTTGEIITATANLNSTLKLNENLMAELQAYLTSLSDMGNLDTPEQHLVVWLSIAKGLKGAS